MKRYSIIHPFALSFFSRELYQDVAKNWKGTGFLYLALLLAACWIPGMIKIGASFSDFVKKEISPLLEEFPEITIKNGEVSINEPMPYFLGDPDTGAVVAIIDTTGEITDLEGADERVLLTKNKLILRKNKMETRGYDLSQINDLKLTREKIRSWLDTARKWLPFALYPFCWFGSFVYRIAQSLIYAVIGLIFVSVLKAGLQYQALIRLSVIAITPPVILETIRDLVGRKIPFWSLLCFLIAMGFLFFGMRANAKKPEPPLSPGM